MAIIKGNQELRRVSGIKDHEEMQILNFLQGSVYSWCKNNHNNWFSIRDLMGGINNDWNGTPLYSLYLKHLNNKSPNPIKSAGKDCGWLLKKVIINDKNNFETKTIFFTRKYRMI